MSAKTGSQITDQTIKGAIVGVATYLFAKWNMDAGLQAALIPAITAVLAYASTKVGDKGTASFLAKVKPTDIVNIAKVIEQVQDLPKLPTTVKDLDKPKPAAKKPAAKKTATKKS